MLRQPEEPRQVPGADAVPIRVLAAVIFRDGRVLVAQRARHKRHGGLWEFPGGKLERGETHLEAAQRELAEELQLVVTSVRRHLVSFDDPGSPFIIEFVEVQTEGHPNPREHEAIAWIAPARLADFSLAPADARFAEWLVQQGQSGPFP